MYRYAVILAYLIFTVSCDNKLVVPEEPAVIDINAKCPWFPVSPQSVYNYGVSSDQSEYKPQLRAIVTDTTLSVGPYVFSQKGCDSLLLTYRGMDNLLIFTKNIVVVDNSISYTINDFTYNIFRIQFYDKTTIKGKEYATRRTEITFTDHQSQADSALVIEYIDNIGVYKITKIKESSSVTAISQMLTLTL